MTPAVDERATPDPASGAARPHHQAALTVAPLTERDFWRAVFAPLVFAIRRPQP